MYSRHSFELLRDPPLGGSARGASVKAQVYCAFDSAAPRGMAQVNGGERVVNACCQEFHGNSGQRASFRSILRPGFLSSGTMTPSGWEKPRLTRRKGLSDAEIHRRERDPGSVQDDG